MNDGQPLIERPDLHIAERFTAMAARVALNPNEFGGACVIVPPGGGDPIEFLLIDTKGDVAQFLGTIKAKLDVYVDQLKSAQQQPGWPGRR